MGLNRYNAENSYNAEDSFIAKGGPDVTSHEPRLLSVPRLLAHSRPDGD
jgi:hypothetical protein